MKIHALTAGLLCVATLTTGACVTRSNYDSAIVDLEATKAELDSARVQSQALTEQVSELQQLTINRAKQLEADSSVLLQAKQQMEAEYKLSIERMRRLNRTIGQLIAQQKNLRYALQRVQEEQPALQSMVEGYKTKLGEAEGARTSLFPPPIAPSNGPAATALAPPSQVAAQTNPAHQPIASADPTVAPANPQSANKQTSEPVEDNWLSMLKAWAISIWRSIFS
jgi:hypothetical protein